MEILACPHCLRLFHATPAALGKKIRCRGCRQIFHVPRDTSSVPLGAAVHAAANGDEPRVAIACVKNGRDTRRCPQCAREFLMKPAFVGKTIRCRRCKAPFQVAATERTIENQPPACVESAVAAPVQAPSPLQHNRQPTQSPETSAIPPHPSSTGFEDMGDVLEDLLPGESVASVVRPSNFPHLHQPAVNPLAHPIAVILCLACGILAVLIVPRYWERDVPKPHEPPPFVPPVVVHGGGKPDPLWTNQPPVPVDPPPPGPVDQAIVEKSLGDAYAALRREDFDAADRALRQAQIAGGQDAEANSRCDRWRLFADYAKKYPAHRDAAFANANKGREYELEGEFFSVVEVGPDQIVYRRAGKKETSLRSSVPPPVEMAIVGKWFAGNDKPAHHIYLGVRWLCLDPPDRERALKQWRIAEAGGGPVRLLLPLLEDPVIQGAAP